MLKRVLAGLAASATLAAAAAIGIAPPAQAKCLDVDGKDPAYCYVSRAEAHVWVTFINESDRRVAIGSLAGLDLKNEQQFRIEPKRKKWIVGRASSGVDITTRVGWCPTTSRCDSWIETSMEFKNPWIGHPWAKVNGAKVGFNTGEWHTFSVPFSRGGKSGIANFRVFRVDDYGKAKHFKVYFSVQ